MEKSQKHIDLVKLIVDRDVWCNQTCLIGAMIENAFGAEKPLIDFYEEVVNLYINTEEEAKDMGFESLEALQDSGEDQKEVFEWWLISDWLARRLEEIGAVILKSPYGTWWGREECGQSLVYDSNINAVAAKLINSSSYIA